MTDPELHLYHDQSRAELIADVIDDTDKVVRALEIQRDPDISIRRFMFELDECPHVLPRSIIQSIDPDSRPTQMTVDVEENRLLDDERREARSSFFSIQLSFEGVRNFVIFITSPEQDKSEPYAASMVFTDDLNDVDALDAGSPELPLLEAITKAEINTLIASLIAPNKTHDYRMYDNMDLTNTQTVHHVAEALEEKADSTIAELDYFTGDVLSLDADYIKFIKVDGKIADATVQRSIVRGAVTATITLDRSLSPPDNGDGAPLEGIRMYSKDISGDSKERDVDFDVLVSIHDFLRSLKDSMFDPEITSLSNEKIDSSHDQDFYEGYEIEPGDDSVDTSTILNIEDSSEFN
ncbi:hypothetical protein H7142_02120 [Candidatus Saccharibacteria bacterium]|nr:hypothetical protein [Candidatus Saccharibacteria bacterium]